MSRYQGGIITKSPATPTGPNPLTGRAPGVWRLDDVAYWIRQGVWPDTSADAYWPYTSMLLSSTSLGNANNNLFVDSSGAFNSVSRTGNTTQGSFTPYGSFWSNYFDGTGDYLASSTAIGDLGTGDFTVEYWALNNTVQGSNFAPQVGTLADATPSNTWRFGTFSATGYLAFAYHTGSTFIDVFFGTTNYNDGVWHHYAVCRSGSTLRAFVDGIQVGSSATVTQNLTSGKALQIGREGYSPSHYTGSISNLRICKATALYTANFTPSSSPLTAITGTTFLSCQSNRFIDNSSNAYAITANGDTAISKFSPFTLASPGITYNQSDITNWSGYFDGDGDYLRVPSNAGFAFGTGDWTIEFWVYVTNTASNMAFVDFRTSGGSIAPMVWMTGGVVYYYTDFINQITGSALTANVWTHIAVARSGTSTKLFINGTQAGSTLSDSYNYVQSPVSIGSFGNTPTSFLAGYISNVRVVKGTAVYTSAFTPPTTNLTAISGTSLLTLQNAAFTDNSTNNFVITQFGNTTVTGNSPFNTVGYWSNYFDGSGDYFTVPYTTANFDWYTAGVDFTIEYWFFANSLTGTSYVDGGTTKSTVVGNRSATNTTDYWSFGPNAGGTVTFYYFNGGPVSVTSTATVTANTWNHVAMTKTSSGITIFVNGAAQTTTAISGTPQSSASFPLTIGQGNNTSYNGYVSNLRIVRGTAIYSGNFTVPTAPLTAVTNTKLLTCQNGRFIDNSTNALTLTVTGNTSVQSFDPFYTSTIASNGGSMYFDGTGDYLTVPDTPVLEPGSSNLTWEMWINTRSSTQYATLYSRNPASFATGMWSLMINVASSTAGDVALYVADFSGASPLLQTTGVNVRDGAWHHIAVVRNGSAWVLYVDGVSRATGTFSGTIANIAGGPSIGRDEFYTRNYLGYISNLRITTGSAIYTAAFTPPTAPVTPSASTTLLVNGMNAGAYDATAINNMETVGNAQVSTVQSKFGGSSVYFDGTGDYLSIPNNNALNFGTGAFTWEGWIYANSLSNIPFIMHKSTGNGTGTGWFIEIGSGAVYVGPGTTGGSFATFSSASVTTNAWFHLAVTRVGTTLTCFVNGTSAGTSTAAGYGSSYDNSAVFAIGGWNPVVSGYDLNGYLDDVRITKGVARYTANFTPPTQAFPPY